LLAFAEREFELGEQQQDGATTKDHLMVLWKRTGVQPELLANQPPLPPAVSHVWYWFCEAHRDRLAVGQQLGRITGAIMQSTEWTLGVHMELWEKKAIRLLDDLYCKVRTL
jgi:hypothetical protein